MATGLSGYLYWTSGVFTVRVNWSETYDTTTNKSKVTINNIQVKKTSTGTAGYYPNGTISINGTVVRTISSSIPTGYVGLLGKDTWYDMKENGVSSTNITCSLDNIEHDSDGSKQVDIELSLKFYMPGSSTSWGVSGAKSITLTTIPRASTFDSLTCNTNDFTGTLTYTYTPKSTSYDTRCVVSLGETIIKTINLGNNKNTQQRPTLSFTSSELTAIYRALSSTSSGTLTFTLTTYSDAYTTQIGNAATKTITLNIPSGSMVITGGTLQWERQTYARALIQNKNTVKVTASGFSASAGSSIKEYKFEVVRQDTNQAILTETIVTSDNGAEVTLGPFSQTGYLIFKVTVTDQRGVKKTVSATTPCYCYAHQLPDATNFTAYRCDASGNPKDNGTHIKYNNITIGFSSIGGSNSVNVDIQYKAESATTWTTIRLGTIQSTSSTSQQTGTISGAIIQQSSGLVSFDTANIYMVRLRLTDGYSGARTLPVVTIFGESRIFNIRPDGNGIAFGKMATQSEMFECRWDAKFNGNIDATGHIDCAGDMDCGGELTCQGNINCNGNIHCYDIDADSITMRQVSIFEMIYPVGSIYMSTNSTNPQSLFGIGDWVQIQDRFLLAASDTYKVGSTGGNLLNNLCLSGANYGGLAEDGDYSKRIFVSPSTIENKGEYSTQATECGADMLPPYLSVYMWRRIE